MFFEVLVCILGKHGVAIHDVNVTETGEVKIDIDFSEHDKVFEDKIAKLVKENAKVYQENMHLEEQCVKKEDEIYKLKIENKELKQHIAELESRETKKPINGWICVAAKEINGQEYVKLEDFLRVVNDLQEQNRFEYDGK